MYPMISDIILVLLFKTPCDQCHALVSSVASLQRLQNAAAQLVVGLRARDHVTSVLSSLHWFPILYRIHYKVVLTMFFIHTNQCLAYLDNIDTPLSLPSPSRQCLCSSTDTNYSIPPTRTKLGER